MQKKTGAERVLNNELEDTQQCPPRLLLLFPPHLVWYLCIKKKLSSEEQGVPGEGFGPQ